MMLINLEKFDFLLRKKRKLKEMTRFSRKLTLNFILMKIFAFIILSICEIKYTSICLLCVQLMHLTTKYIRYSTDIFVYVIFM